MTQPSNSGVGQAVTGEELFSLLLKHCPLRQHDTEDFAEIFDVNGEKVALSIRPELVMCLNEVARALAVERERSARMAEVLRELLTPPMVDWGRADPIQRDEFVAVHTTSEAYWRARQALDTEERG